MAKQDSKSKQNESKKSQGAENDKKHNPLGQSARKEDGKPRKK